MKALIATIIGFIKAHTVISIVIAAAVVTVGVATPITIHLVTKKIEENVPSSSFTENTENDSTIDKNDITNDNNDITTDNNVYTDTETDATVTPESNDNTTSNNANTSNTNNNNSNQDNATTNPPTHTHTFSDATCVTPKTCSCGATEGSALGHKYSNGTCTVCGNKDPNFVEKWTYKNGGDNYIIKSNCSQEVKIFIPGDYTEYIADNTRENEYGKDICEIKRETITPYNDWIFYSEYYVYTYISKETPEDSYSYSRETEFYKIKEDGTQKTRIGFTGAKESYEPVVCDLIGAKGEFLYFFVFDGGYGRSEENELNLYRISMNSNSTDIAKDGERIAYIDSAFYIKTSKSYIDGEWIYFESSDSKYKIKIDGTEEQQIG